MDEPVIGQVDAVDLEQTLQLLRRVFRDPRFDTTAFVDWVYNHNPVGPVYEEHVDEGGMQVAHIAGVPVHYRNAVGVETFVMMYNVATAPTKQGMGHYVNLCFDLIERTRGQVAGFLGVPNERSVSPDVNVIRTRLLGSLPVRIVTPTSLQSKRVDSVRADAAFLASAEFADLVAGVDDAPASDWTQCWPLETVRWRLSWPIGPYAVHASPDVVAITARTTRKGVPFTVLCKLLPRHGRPGPHPSADVIAAACRYHRTPLAVYAGWNAHVPVKGVQLKQSWLPAPLALVYLANSDRVDQDSFAYDTFEFLDFDAY